MLKNRVVAKVLNEFEEAKSYLTSMSLESRKKVTWRLPPIWIVMNIRKDQQISPAKLTEKVQVSTGPYKSSCCTPPSTAFDWARIFPGKGWMKGSTLNKVFLSLSVTQSEGKIAMALDSQKAGTCWVCCCRIEGQNGIRDQSPIIRRVLEIKHTNLELSVTGPIPSNFLAQINLDYKFRLSWSMLSSTATLLTNPPTILLTSTSNLCCHDRECLSVYSNLKITKYLL